MRAPRKKIKLTIVAFAMSDLLVGVHAQNRSLADRYASLSCAIVKIQSDGMIGTGSFVSSTGDVLTAAHVALIRDFQTGGTVTVTYRSNLRLLKNGQSLPAMKLPELSEEDTSRSNYDLVILRTGLKTDCYLRIGESNGTKIGNHVIALAYTPSTKFPGLYDGIVNLRAVPEVPLATEVKNVGVNVRYEMFLIQMPTVPGNSGAPLLGDDDSVIGVLVNAPLVWATELTNFMNEQENRPGGIMGANKDTPALLAKLALAVFQSAAAGAGVAVPISYLNWAPPKRDKPPLGKANKIQKHP